jgi:hypothetical protein
MQYQKEEERNNQIMSKFLALMTSSDSSVGALIKYQTQQLVNDVKQLRFTLDKTGNVGILHNLEKCIAMLHIEQSRLKLRGNGDRVALFSDLCDMINYEDPERIVKCVTMIQDQAAKFNIDPSMSDFNEVKRLLLDFAIHDGTNEDCCPFCQTSSDIEEGEDYICHSCGCCYDHAKGWSFAAGGSHTCNHLAYKPSDEYQAGDSVHDPYLTVEHLDEELDAMASDRRKWLKKKYGHPHSDHHPQSHSHSSHHEDHPHSDHHPQSHSHSSHHEDYEDHPHSDHHPQSHSHSSHHEDHPHSDHHPQSHSHSSHHDKVLDETSSDEDSDDYDESTTQRCIVSKSDVKDYNREESLNAPSSRSIVITPRSKPRSASIDTDYNTKNTKGVRLPTPNNGFKSAINSPVRRSRIIEPPSIPRATPSPTKRRLFQTPHFKPSFKKIVPTPVFTRPTFHSVASPRAPFTFVPPQNTPFMKSLGGSPRSVSSFSKKTGSPRVYSFPKEFHHSFGDKLTFPPQSVPMSTFKTQDGFKASYGTPGSTRNSVVSATPFFTPTNHDR